MSQTLSNPRSDSWQQIMGTAFGLVAIAIWFPAITLPMMTFSHFGRKTETGLLAGVEKLYDHGNTTIAVFVFLVSIVFPLTKGIALVLEGLYPYQTQASGVGTRIVNLIRLPFRIQAKYSLGEMMVLALSLMALSGAYGIKTYLNLGFWIFALMLVAMILSTGLLKWAYNLRKEQS